MYKDIGYMAPIGFLGILDDQLPPDRLDLMLAGAMLYSMWTEGDTCMMEFIEDCRDILRLEKKTLTPQLEV